MNRGLLVAAVTLVLVGAGVALFVSRSAPTPLVPVAASMPAITTSRAATEPTTEPVPPTTRMIDVLVEADALFRGAVQQKNPLVINDGAAVILRHPVYIDFRGDLWITDPNAPAIRDVLKDAGDQAVHVVREEVVWARWVRNNRGNWVCQPVTREGGTREGGKFVWHAQDHDIVMERSDYLFENLVLLADDRVIVPTGEGVTVIRPPEILQPLPRGAQSRPATAPSALGETFAAIAGTTPVTCYATPNGKIALAFRPWDNGDQGSEGILRLGKEGWAPLPEGTYAKQPIHVFFMTDGSLQFVSLGEDGGVNVSVELPLEPTPVNTALVERLVEKLNDPNDVVRDAAEDAIARFGPSAWPVLEKMREAQTPEGRKVVDHLLGARQKKTLGIFTLRPGPARVVSRTPNGALAILTSGGVDFLDNENEQFRAPALIIDRPGSPVFLAHESMIEKRDPEKFKLQMIKDDLLLADPVSGVLRHMGNHYSAMLKPKYRDFSWWMGQDREFRWVFKNPTTGEFLLLDPNYSDPAPRLPTWTLKQSAAGYDDADHPAVERQGLEGTPKSYWQLDQSGWAAIDGKKNHFHVEPRRSSATARLGDGTTVTADMANLTFRRRSATRPTMQALPPEAFGVNPPTLVYAAEHLFLFNTPGRVTRFGRDKEGKWGVDATFTAEIPNGEVHRIWLDPFGRICITWDDKLTLLFPDGQIPTELQDLIHPNK